MRPRVVVFAALALWPAHAGAVDGVKPRSNPMWPHEPCMVVVDRSVDPVLNLPYDIEFEDPPPGESLQPWEVADSRTHQFFAIARSVDSMSRLPVWVTWADIDAYALVAVDHNMLWTAESIDDDDVYETSTTWASLWFRINLDDDRRPIEPDVAAAGIDWDTAAVPLGTYEIHGLTWEPPGSEYARRGGVVKVTDGGDTTQYGPAVAFDWTPMGVVLYRDQSTVLTGCVDAMEGTTLTGEWSPFAPVEWTAFASNIEVTSNTFELELVAPEPLAGYTGMVRVTARDPMDREYSYYLNGDLTVLSFEDPGACGESGGGFIGDPGCGGSESGTTTEASGGGDSATTAPAADPEGGEPSSCNCSSVGTRAPAWLAAIFLLGLGRQRRRADRRVEFSRR